jgi:hypothetical protein
VRFLVPIPTQNPGYQRLEYREKKTDLTVGDTMRLVKVTQFHQFKSNGKPDDELVRQVIENEMRYDITRPIKRLQRGIQYILHKWNETPGDALSGAISVESIHCPKCKSENVEFYDDDPFELHCDTCGQDFFYVERGHEYAGIEFG